jgi:hypothetical protein
MLSTVSTQLSIGEGNRPDAPMIQARKRLQAGERAGSIAIECIEGSQLPDRPNVNSSKIEEVGQSIPGLRHVGGQFSSTEIDWPFAWIRKRRNLNASFAPVLRPACIS